MFLCNRTIMHYQFESIRQVSVEIVVILEGQTCSPGAASEQVSEEAFHVHCLAHEACLVEGAGAQRHRT